MEKNQLRQEHPLVSGVRQSRFIPFWWLAPFICYGLTKFGRELGKLLAAPIIDSNVGVLDWANTIDSFSIGLTALIYFALVRFVEGRSIRTMGFPKKGALPEFLIGCVIGGGMVALVVAIASLFGAVTFLRFSLDAPTLFAFFLAGLSYIVQASTEEIYTRGWLLPVMASNVNKWVAIIVSSSFFSAIHLGNTGVNYLSSLNAALFGVLVAVYAWKKGDIWGACGMHVAWNFVLGNVFGLNVSGYTSESAIAYFDVHGAEWLSGGSYGIEASVVSTVVYGAVIAYIIWVMKPRTPECQL